MKPVNERNNQALAMRESGMTYAKIAEYFGVTRGRAQQMVLAAQQRDVRLIEKGTIQELPTKTFNALRNSGLGPNATADDVIQTFRERAGGGGLDHEFLRVKNLGREALRQVKQWLRSYGHEV